MYVTRYLDYSFSALSRLDISECVRDEVMYTLRHVISFTNRLPSLMHQAQITSFFILVSG